MRQTHGGGRQVGLLRRCRKFHCGHDNIQNSHQQHSLHRKCGHDDDGLKKLCGKKSPHADKLNGSILNVASVINQK
jgi:hypothetical protein